MDKISLIVADDHPLIRIGLTNIIKENKNYTLLGTASNGKEALDLIFDLEPLIAILDIEMPIKNGLQVCEEVKNEKLKTKILFLTMLKEEDLFRAALKSGADGYLLKDDALDELDVAIQSIYNGNRYVGKGVENFLINSKSHIIQNDKLSVIIKKLTKTEKDILIMISQQIKTKEIASKLFISESTVKNHRHNIVKKLELDNDQNSLLKFAIENVMYLISNS